MTLVARPGRAEVAELVAAGAGPGRWSPYAAVLPGGDPGAIPAVREGRAGVQDEGSQLVALALAAAPLDGHATSAGSTCAPGPAARPPCSARWPRAGALRCWRPSWRRTGPGWCGARSATATGVVVADGRVPAWRAGSFDRVLVDAPCTGLGALRRRPEARWRRQPADVAGLAALQRDLLAAALDAVRPGGLVAYVTCSPHLAETRTVVADVLRAPAPVSSSWTPGRCCPPCPTWATGRTCSSGRTGTAPTRCTSRCSGAAGQRAC